MPEAAFNAACYHTGRGDYQNALDELNRAETLCRQTYDDQEDELSSELAQVRLQDRFLYIISSVGNTTSVINVVSPVMVLFFSYICFISYICDFECMEI